ncbi:hypothetical protein BHE74_00030460 [Ensete ventricosum]|nr:hypothetical protein BHE74_00030460 [Ensete ventricosum]
MSWLARSLANSLIPDRRSDSGGDEIAARAAAAESRPLESDEGSGEEEIDPSRGVKEDLSELSKTLARQFWGVASFLAPPPQSSDGDSGRRPDPPPPSDNGPAEASDSASMTGIRCDFAEIGGRFGSGFSKISGNMGVSEISKIASNFLQLRAEEEEEQEEEEEEEEDDDSFSGGAIGITEEVMSFVRNISMHPETWLDFPLLSDDEDSDGNRSSSVHIDLMLISSVVYLPNTNRVVEARALLLQKLQNQHKSDSHKLVDVYRKSEETSFPPLKQVTTSTDAYETSSTESQQIIYTEKHPVQAAHIEFIDKSVIEERPPTSGLVELSIVSKASIKRSDDDDDDDDWLKDETGDIDCSGSLTIAMYNEDVSFSDLEEEDDPDAPKALK